MNKKPLIGISCSIIIDSGGMFPGYKRSYVNYDYVRSVIEAGGIPIQIPFTENKEVLEEQVKLLDGLILSGGHDLDPYNYGEDPNQKIGEVFPQRDQFDFELIRQATKKNIPILGICRGLQIINVFYGGNLYQDLSCVKSDKEILKHSQNHTPELPTHDVSITYGTILSNIMKDNKIRVNSFHHQVIHEVSDEFKVSASLVMA